jgi:hypothetical protein
MLKKKNIDTPHLHDVLLSRYTGMGKSIVCMLFVAHTDGARGESDVFFIHGMSPAPNHERGRFERETNCTQR